MARQEYMKIIQLIISIIVAQGAGAIGSIFTAQSVTGWFAGLNKPSFNPPGWLFGPVWLTLYTLMGVASYWVFQKWSESPLARVAIIVYGVHLIFNALWSFLFFGLKNPSLAFICIIVLWLMIIAVIILFYMVDKRTLWLLLPYLLWVSFAAVLNFSLWRMN